MDSFKDVAEAVRRADDARRSAKTNLRKATDPNDFKAVVRGPRPILEDLEKGIYHKTSTVTRKDGKTYNTSHWTEGPNPPPARQWQHLEDAPAEIPPIETSPVKMEPLRPVSGVSHASGAKVTGSAGDHKVAQAAQQVSKHLPAVAGSIARSLAGPNHMADASDPAVEHSANIDDALGVYDRGNNRIVLSPGSMHAFYEALENGKGWTSETWNAAKTFVHEALHHASNKFRYEPYGKGKGGDMSRRPHAALEEATTETLANHLAPHIVRNILGMKIEGDPEEKRGLGELPPPSDEQRRNTGMRPSLASQIAKPMFQRVEDPYGNGDEWEIGEGHAPSYRSFVKRFANLVSYADDLHKNPGLTNQEFSDHVARRALDVKRRPQTEQIDHRWDALTSKVLEKFDLPAQYEHWLEESALRRTSLGGQILNGDGSPASPERQRAWDDERKTRWNENIYHGVNGLLRDYLTGEGLFHPEKYGHHVGVLQDAVKATVEGRGLGANGLPDGWKPRVKKGFIGRRRYDQEGRPVSAPKPERPTTPSGLAQLLQTAYHHADYASGNKEMGLDIPRGDALREAVRAARLAGYPFDRVPTKLEDAAAFRDKLEGWAGDQGLHAPRGIVMMEGDKELHALDKEIRARRLASNSLVTLKEKLAAQEEIRKLKAQRDRRDSELYSEGKLA